MHGDASEARQGAPTSPVLRLPRADAVEFMQSGTIHFESRHVRLMSWARGFVDAEPVTAEAFSKLLAQKPSRRRQKQRTK